MPYPYNITGDAEGNETLYVFTGDGGEPVIVKDDHPKFHLIRDVAENGDAGVDDSYLRDLADQSGPVARVFEPITERLTVAGGRLYFDGDEVHGSIASHILRAIEFDSAEPWPFAEVRFLEKVQQNPEQHSRDQLYDWLQAHEFTITDEGDIVGYKGVVKDGDDLRSGSSGRAIVDGVEHTGQIPNPVGATVTMPRGSVQHNPGSSCSTGLHVGTFDYAQGFARGALLKVYVNPRDVVSVPTDAGGEKVRVCRYVVAEVIEAPETVPVLASIADEYGSEEDECPYCGYTTCDGDCGFDWLRREL